MKTFGWLLLALNALFMGFNFYVGIEQQSVSNMIIGTLNLIACVGVLTIILD